MNHADTQKWVQLTREHPNADSTRFVSDLIWFDSARYVLDQNLLEAVELSEKFEENAAFIATSTHQQENVVHRAFVRRFHNYVAAAKTMVANTKTLRSRWGNTPAFESLWDRQIAAFEVRPVVCFIKGMRDAIQHSRFPEINRVTSFEPVPPGPHTVRPRFRFMVDEAELFAMFAKRQRGAKDDSARAAARDYIEHAGEGTAPHRAVDMTLALRDYHAVVDPFNEWFRTEIRSAREDLMSDFKTRKAELVRLQGLP